MEEGSLRCDANISVRKNGDLMLGTKAEIKNLNSIRNVKRAIEFESRRMIEMLEQGTEIIQQTRSFDADSGTTFSIRDKEDADDYRYFPDPDLTKFFLTDEFIDNVRRSIPELHGERSKRYVNQYHLSEYDAAILTEEKEFADYFEKVIGGGVKFKSAANWMLGPVKSWLNETNEEIGRFPVTPEKLAGVIKLVEDGKLSFSIASTKLLNELLKDPQKEPLKISEEKNWSLDTNTDNIENLIEQVLNKFPEKVKEFKKGKKGLMGLFVGEVIKLSKGKADPKMTNDILSEKLKS
jgi:aspartyl-tRNA(Asn)/glutamyl-tRNA(Gln) amidotransferase subunit B